jgi:4-hydroxybenzoate polyprenyltransferase
MKKYLSLIKFSHSVFALPFAVIGFFLAMEESPNKVPFSIAKFLLMIACMILARSAAMSFNRYLDRDIDAKNPRNKNREIPKGLVSASQALFYTLLNSTLFIFCTAFINQICFLLSPVALLVILGYSFTKRFTPLCHFVLGIGLSLAPIGAYLVVSGHFAIVPILFSLAVFTWVSGFDILYALPDEEFDRMENLYSIPALLGKSNSINLTRFLHFLSIGFVVIAGFLGNFHLFYWIGVLIYIGLLTYQNILVKPNDLSKLNLAFFTLNGIASLVFSGFFLIDYFINTISA